jgi:hypothetical protein
MGTIIKHSELVRKALEYICEVQKDRGTPLPELLDDAGRRFNLSPKDMQVLERYFKDNQE